MAISKCTSMDITRILNISQKKIRTISLAPGPEFSILPNSEHIRIREKYDLKRPFFFYPGILSPRKNIAVFFEAFAKIQKDIPHDLIITAGGGYKEVGTEMLRSNGEMNRRIRRLGLVPKNDLVALYNTAEALVFPSLYEGFGLPILEAFACGCPVICSTASAFREVAGEATLTFAPSNSSELAKHLVSIVHDSALRKQLIESGFEQVKKFTYAHAARNLLQLLEEAVI